MATERRTSPQDIKDACNRLEEAARGKVHRYAGDPMDRERDFVTVMMAARTHAEMIEQLRNQGPRGMTTEPAEPAEPADSLIRMTFMGIVVQINPALPPGHCQIIGPEGKLLATFQV